MASILSGPQCGNIFAKFTVATDVDMISKLAMHTTARHINVVSQITGIYTVLQG